MITPCRSLGGKEGGDGREGGRTVMTGKEKRSRKGIEKKGEENRGGDGETG